MAQGQVSGAADLAFALAENDAGGGMQRRVLGSALASGPSRQSSRSQHSRSSAMVAVRHHARFDVGRGRGQVTKTGLLARTHGVLDTGVRAVAGIEELHGAARGVLVATSG